MRSKEKYFTVISIVLISLLVIVGIISQLNQLNSDSLVSYHVSRDILSSFSVSGWTIGTHSYLFPDIFIITLINIFSQSYITTHALYFIIQILLLITVVLKLLDRLGVGRVLAVYYILFITIIIESWMGTFIVPPGTHSSLFLVTLLIPLLLSQTKNFEKLKAVVFVFLLLISFSDMLALTYLLIPLTIVLYFKGSKKHSLLTLLLSLSIFIFTKDFNQLLGFEIVNNPSQDFVISFKNFIDVNLILFFKKKPFEGFFIVIGQAFLFHQLIFISFKQKKLVKRWGLWFMFLSSWSTLTSTVVTGYFVDSSSIRYYLPFIYFGHIAFLLLLTKLDKKKYVSYLLILVMVLVGLKKIGKSSDLFSKVAISDRKCILSTLSQNEKKEGIAEYWVNKRFFVDSSISIIQVSPNLEEYNVLINKFKHNKRLENAKFIIANGINKPLLEKYLVSKRNRRTILCGKIQLELFD